MGKEENGVSCPTAPVYSGHSCFPQQISKIMHPLKEQSQHLREHFSLLCITLDMMETWDRKMQYVTLASGFWVCYGPDSFSKTISISWNKSRLINFICSGRDLLENKQKGTWQCSIFKQKINKVSVTGLPCISIWSLQIPTYLDGANLTRKQITKCATVLKLFFCNNKSVLLVICAITVNKYCLSSKSRLSND